MELFVTVMNAVNDIIWHPVMCVFLMCAAIWFTIRLQGIQVRRFKDMIKCLMEKGDNKKDTDCPLFRRLQRLLADVLVPVILQEL